MGGRYRAYPEYKDSEVLWLGEVPEKWSKFRFKHLFGEKNKVTNSNLPAGSISFGNVVYKNEDNLAVETKQSYQEILSGEFLINPLNLNFDLKSLRTALSDIDVVVSTGYIVLKCLGKLNKRFARWVLQEFDVAHMKTLGSGVRQTINFTDIGNSFLYVPSISEQSQIANFLDHETAKIDTLIDRQQQLIALLKEKRQAVISHAVTKGLNPGAPMKDSGIEWLGEVPEHWQLPKIAHHSRVINGSTPDKNNLAYWEDGDIPWLASSCLNSLVVNEPSMLISNLAYKSCSVELIPAGAVLVGMVGQGKTRGTAALLGFASCINQNMAAVIPKETVMGEYLLYVFQAMYEDLRELGRGGNQAALNCEIIGSLRVPLPIYTEQLQIVAWLKSKVEKLNLIEILAQKQTHILQERRTALISAAVTGKIDVRDWQLSPSSSTTSKDNP